MHALNNKKKALAKAQEEGSVFRILILSLSLIQTQEYFAVTQMDSFFRLEITFVEGQMRNVSDARVYIQEYPQYGIPGGTDL